MSSYTAIQDVTEELRRLIFEALENTSDTDFGLTTEETDIILSAPPQASSGPPLLSLFLYHIEPDSHLRNQPYLAVGTDGLRSPPLPLQLYYLVTPLDDDESQNHLVLGRILQHFHDNPFVTGFDNQPLDNSFGGSSPEMRITLETLTLEELSRVWHALNIGYQLSVAYKVRVVAIDSAQTEAAARRVTEMHTAVGQKG